MKPFVVWRYLLISDTNYFTILCFKSIISIILLRKWEAQMPRKSIGRPARSKVDLSDDTPAITPGVAARLLGISTARLRMLEADGLVQPHRAPNGRRLYSRNDLNSMQLLAMLSSGLGLPRSGVRAAMAVLQEAKASGLDPVALLQRVMQQLAPSGNLRPPG
jgi:DNA-binding transcriptional MerR regulator